MWASGERGKSTRRRGSGPGLGLRESGGSGAAGLGRRPREGQEVECPRCAQRGVCKGMVCLLWVLVCIVCGLEMGTGPATAGCRYPSFLHFVVLLVVLLACFWFGTGMWCYNGGRVLRPTVIHPSGREEPRAICYGAVWFFIPHAMGQCVPVGGGGRVLSVSVLALKRGEALEWIW